MPDKSDKLLVLDLDETLIHATSSPLAVPPDFQFDSYHVYRRPGLEQFLLNISQHFTLGVWSSASDEYVEEIVKTITPDAIEWFLIWGRSRCTIKRDYTLDNYYFEKKLEKVKNKGLKLEQVIIVDDSPEKARSNYGNAVYIKPFEGNREEDEFLALQGVKLLFHRAGFIICQSYKLSYISSHSALLSFTTQCFKCIR